MNGAFAQLITVSSSLIREARSQPDPELAEAFFRRAISTAYYALFHRITSDISLLLLPELEASSQTAFRRCINHRDFKGLHAELKAQQKKLQQTDESVSYFALAKLTALCEDLLQLQGSRVDADYGSSLEEPDTTAEEAVAIASLAIDDWDQLPLNAHQLLAQTLLCQVILSRRNKQK